MIKKQTSLSCKSHYNSLLFLRKKDFFHVVLDPTIDETLARMQCKAKKFRSFCEDHSSQTTKTSHKDSDVEDELHATELNSDSESDENE